MTSEQTVASPLVIPQRTTDGDKLTLIGGPARDHSSPTFLLAADSTAALLGTVALTPLQRQPLLLAGFVLLVLALHRTAGLYRRAEGRHILDDCPALAGRVGIAWCALTAAAASLPTLQPIPLRAVLSGCAVHLALTVAGRALVLRRRRAALIRRPCATLLVGPEPAASRVAAALQRHRPSGIRLVGIVGRGTAGPHAEGEEPTVPVLTNADDVRRAVIQNGVRRAIFLGSAGAPEYRPWLSALDELRCSFWELDPDHSAYVPERGAAEGHLAGFRCRSLSGAAHRLHPGKRALDLAVSAVLLLLVSPVLLVCALWLRVSEGPGVVFRQERVGKDGRPFTLLKFRTHRPADPLESATRWSVANEHHMPWFCRFLRRTSLDELLQLWNVFRGDMSLVGPRPERPYFVMKFGETYPGYSDRHRVPTGITGLAQINGLRGDTSIEDRCRFDNAYIDNWSLWGDLSILARTATEFFRPTGS
ncbi:exopolysaccharide biosynthesis polyprenyl glycosylphosphotransferase [Streptomyces kunmingensis]|uniref:Exopolysaccharide biosynthesis polyprenyl glycosylphosphotransferase n=1 Tax=Streptomyces kunmingensis TaxID=68225 RepID=A0ABU6C5P7_9ACTN|nr:exopolysaccharide biosynthesis polyprenyl glycosylphosphotransferase [Streptomyces kunmingensis]MEB3959655.1 exopolysaccharide biosynthesis polyprenyl glycosylphosphotransferase [Streptomyces kunmingensis]